jgi:hypothetical protein
MEIFGYGAFQIVNNDEGRFYRHKHSYGHRWYKYEFSTGNLLPYELYETLEVQYQALVNGKPATAEKNNEEIFDLIFDAIKNKTAFDSKPYQPNSGERFLVNVSETSIDLVATRIKNNHSQILATFTEKDVKIYFPEIYANKRNHKFLNNLLTKLNVAFETDKFSYRYKLVRNDKIRIDKMNFYYDQGVRGCVFEYIPFVNPLIITL